MQLVAANIIWSDSIDERQAHRKRSRKTEDTGERKICGDRSVGFSSSCDIMATAAAERVVPFSKEIPLEDAQAKASPELTCNLQVEYPTEELARIVMTTLSVDAELQPDKVARSMKAQGRHLSISFRATEARYLRASFSAFMDMLVLATRTIEEFGPSSVDAAT